MSGRLEKAEICKRLEKAILSLCRSCLPNDDIAIDAIICLSVTKTSEEHVVKIHQNFTASLVDYENAIGIDIDKDNCDSSKSMEKQKTVRIAWNKSKRPKLQQGDFSSSPSENNQSIIKGNHHGTLGKSIPNSQYRSTMLGPMRIPSQKRKTCQSKGQNDSSRDEILSNGEMDSTNSENIDISNLQIKIEPLEDLEYGVPKDCQNDDDDGIQQSENRNEHSSVMSSDFLATETSSNGMRIVSRPSPFPNYATGSPYRYTADSVHQHTPSECGQVNAARLNDKSGSGVEEEACSDDDNQSLGGSPTDLTNSLISYSLNHILPPGDQEDDEIRSAVFLQSSTPDQGGRGLTQKLQIKESSRKTFHQYDCQFCGAHFSSRRTCIRHEKSTCGYTKFECVICRKCFSRKDARRRHMLRAHGTDHCPNL